MRLVSSDSMNTQTCNYQGANGRPVFRMDSEMLIISLARHDAQIILLQPHCTNTEETKFSPEEQAAAPALLLT